MRLLRAFYRYQLYCNLFGDNGTLRSLPESHGHDWDEDRDFFKGFLRIYKSWQVEEFACIHTFAVQKLDRILDEIRWDVHENNPKFDGQGHPPQSNRLISIMTVSSPFLLPFSCSIHVLFKIKNHSHLVSTMQESIKRPTRNFQEDALNEMTEDVRIEVLQDLEDDWQAPSAFQCDDIHSAPLSWTLVWRDYYSDNNQYKNHAGIRCWGYIMWDAARLEDTGAKELLLQQQEKAWGDDEWVWGHFV